jgi:hypothetical protein
MAAPRGEIDLGPFREAFERSGLTKVELARRLGCDETCVRRLMGASKYLYRNGKRYGPYVQAGTSYRVAESLARAMDVDPFEVGI